MRATGTTGSSDESQAAHGALHMEILKRGIVERTAIGQPEWVYTSRQASSKRETEKSVQWRGSSSEINPREEEQEENQRNTVRRQGRGGKPYVRTSTKLPDEEEEVVCIPARKEYPRAASYRMRHTKDKGAPGRREICECVRIQCGGHVNRVSGSAR
ncbi:hypothetical protein K438DRAFT_1760993 [Mycena galopus ATCC 62051]|nr:hypothetical protein K438DRAFT_1760993 [Mycena galopus ATCC 62051]